MCTIWLMNIKWPRPQALPSSSVVPSHAPTVIVGPNCGRALLSGCFYRQDPEDACLGTCVVGTRWTTTED